MHCDKISVLLKVKIFLYRFVPSHASWLSQIWSPKQDKEWLEFLILVQLLFFVQTEAM